MPNPESASGPKRSGLFDYVFAFGSLGTAIYLLYAYGFSSSTGGLGRTNATGYCAFWAFLVLRMHLHVAWLGGLGPFFHLCTRFPATWMNTVTYFPLLFALKLFMFAFCEVFLLDFVGQVYECRGSSHSLERYARMCRDLNKPLMFRKTGSWWEFTIYPFMVSTSCAANLYCLGPYTGFGVLTLFFDKNHVTFRNGLFGTHPAYNYHVTISFDNENGKAWWHTAHALMPYIGVEELIFKRLWNFYADNMIKVIEESEERAGCKVTAPSTEFGSGTDGSSTWKPAGGCFAWQGRERKHVVETTPIVSGAGLHGEPGLLGRELT